MRIIVSDHITVHGVEVGNKQYIRRYYSTSKSVYWHHAYSEEYVEPAMSRRLELMFQRVEKEDEKTHAV